MFYSELGGATRKVGEVYATPTSPSNAKPTWPLTTPTGSNPNPNLIRAAAGSQRREMTSGVTGVLLGWFLI